MKFLLAIVHPLCPLTLPIGYKSPVVFAVFGIEFILY